MESKVSEKIDDLVVSRVATKFVGARFGRWVVIQVFEHQKWLCKCACGSEKLVFGGSLIRGASTSCGCFSAELSSARRKASAATEDRRRQRRKASVKRYNDRISLQLGDGYIKQLIRYGYPEISAKDIPQSLIEIKREQLSLRRLENELKQVLNEKEK